MNKIQIDIQCSMNIDGQIRGLHAADADHGAMNAVNPFHLPFGALIYTLHSNLYCSSVWPLQIVHMYYENGKRNIHFH